MLSGLSQPAFLRRIALCKRPAADGNRPRRRLRYESLETRLPFDITFGVIGDFGADNQPELDVANLVKSWNPDFIVTTGDNGYNTTAANIDRFVGKYYQQFIGNYQGAYGPGAGLVNRFFPSAGNHDWDGGGGTLNPYTNYFTLPGNERYYDFVQGDVHFFVVSSDPREPHGISSGSTQGQWLQAGLAASTSAWQTVVVHHAPFSSGADHGSTVALQWPFQQWGADIVLAGHDHTYERIVKNDANHTNFPFLVIGSSGHGTLYNFAAPVAGSLVRYNANWGALRVTASATTMTIQFINRAGATIDSYTIHNQPTVSLTAPANNAMLLAENTIALAAAATAPPGRSIAQVEFFQGATLLGADAATPYRFDWTNPSAGNYTLTARVTDSSGAQTTSAPINIVVQQGATLDARFEIESVFDNKNRRQFSAISSHGRAPVDDFNSTAEELAVAIEPGVNRWWEARFENLVAGSSNPTRALVDLQYRPEAGWAGAFHAEYWTCGRLVATIVLPANAGQLKQFQWDVTPFVKTADELNNSAVRLVNRSTNGRTVFASFVSQQADIANDRAILNLNAISLVDNKNAKTYSPSSSDGRIPLNDINTIYEERTVIVEPGGANGWDVNFEDPNASLGAPNRVATTLRYRPDAGWTGVLRAEFRVGAAVLATVNLPATGGQLATYVWDVSSVVTTGANLRNGVVRLINLSSSAKNVAVAYAAQTANFGGAIGLLMAADAPTTIAIATVLDDLQLQPIVAEAYRRWQAAGANIMPLAGMQIRVADLPDKVLGMATDREIVLDDNAAGWGWFVDPTPRDDIEFSTPGDQGEQRRIDLLSVVMHELGHVLGDGHEDVGLMDDVLAEGIRASATDARSR